MPDSHGSDPRDPQAPDAGSGDAVTRTVRRLLRRHRQRPAQRAGQRPAGRLSDRLSDRVGRSAGGRSAGEAPDASDSLRDCPHCGETVHVYAVRCRHCGQGLEG